MNKYRCLIVDDEELARELLETHLKQLNNFELVASCASAIEASEVLKVKSVDLLFLDIQMPVLKGTDFYRSLKQKPKVIFTTAYRDYALDGFDLDAIDYLLKPITFSRFFKAIEKFLATEIQIVETPTKEHKAVNTHIFVRKDRKQVKIILDSILYIQSLKDYIKIYLSDNTHIVKHSITSFEQELNNHFLRVHRSYIVNKNKITAYTKHDIEIGEIEIPIGDHYKKSISEEFDNS